MWFLSIHLFHQVVSGSIFQQKPNTGRKPFHTTVSFELCSPEHENCCVPPCLQVLEFAVNHSTSSGSTVINTLLFTRTPVGPFSSAFKPNWEHQFVAAPWIRSWVARMHRLKKKSYVFVDSLSKWMVLLFVFVWELLDSKHWCLWKIGCLVSFESLYHLIFCEIPPSLLPVRTSVRCRSWAWTKKRPVSWKELLRVILDILSVCDAIPIIWFPQDVVDHWHESEFL